jgi:hypothetical protein
MPSRRGATDRLTCPPTPLFWFPGHDAGTEDRSDIASDLHGMFDIAQSNLGSAVDDHVRETVDQGRGGQNEPIEWQGSDHSRALRFAHPPALFRISMVGLGAKWSEREESNPRSLRSLGRKSA